MALQWITRATIGAFYTLKEASVVIERWRRHDNTIRPHSSLAYRSPAPEVTSGLRNRSDQSRPLNRPSSHGRRGTDFQPGPPKGGRPNLVGPGLPINGVGGDCPGKTELHADILRRSDIFVEYAPQTRIEGEIQQLPVDHPVTELWRVIRGEAEGRRHARQITLFDSVGFAVEDFSALRYVRAKLAGTGFYEDLDLLANPDESRDLFGMLLRARA